MTAQSFRKILETLDEHGVELIVVGGVAAVLQGAPVTTFDIDTLVKVDERNSERLLDALTAMNARYREHSTLRPTKDDLLAGGHLLLMTSHGPLDVLGFFGKKRRYEDLADAASVLRVGDLSLRVLTLEQLIEQKKSLGRDKDLATLRLLEEVLRRRGR
jgi:predicted nucleotidyltransferase